MDDSVDIRDLQIAVNLVSMRKHLNYLGALGIGIGLLLLAAVFSTHIQIMTKIAMGGLSVIFVVQGILLITKPTPLLMLVDCFGLAGIGVFLVLNGDSSHWMQFILMIFWVFRAFEEYMDFRKKVPQTPVPEIMTLMTSMVKDIRTRYVPTSKDIIIMSDKSSTWRILLKGEMAVFVNVNEDQISVKSREEDPLSAHRDSVSARIVEVSSAATGDQKFQMSAEHYQRYLAWKWIPAG